MSKRLFDIIFSIFLLFLLLPVIVIMIILELIYHGRPLFFIQDRPGYNGKIFRIYKFRTMRNDCDKSGKLLPDEKRLTKFGKFLRSTSFDELPELFNVIKGDMSIVGPRPLLVQYIPLYTKEQSRRHDVKPGITGWAQINGRNAVSWEEKFKMDIWYVENRTFMLDMKIIIHTIFKVLSRNDINQEGYATAKIFEGTNNEKVKG